MNHRISIWQNTEDDTFTAQAEGGCAITEDHPLEALTQVLEIHPGFLAPQHQITIRFEEPRGAERAVL